jgi:adenylate kinase family enzyme
VRVAIVGNSGSGKSTLASQIAAAHSVVSLDLDTVAWEPGKIAVSRSVADAAADLTAFCATHDRWVVEGCYAGLVQQTLEHAPILVFIDPGVEACLANCRSRPWEPHKYASKAEQDEKLEFLLSWVREYYSRDGDVSLVAHQALFEKYRGPKLRLAHRDTPLLDHLGARFEACEIPAHEWTHAAHLVVGLWHVHRYGADEALMRLRSGIRRLNESHGGVNSATNGYHETITAAYVQLLAEYLDSTPTDLSLSMRAIGLLGSPLVAKDVLVTFYSLERLMSTEARAGWIDPDRGPVCLTAVQERKAAALQG